MLYSKKTLTLLQLPAKSFMLILRPAGTTMDLHGLMLLLIFRMHCSPPWHVIRSKWPREHIIRIEEQMIEILLFLFLIPPFYSVVMKDYPEIHSHNAIGFVIRLFYPEISETLMITQIIHIM